MGPSTYPFHHYGPLYLSLSSLWAPLPIPFISTGPFTYPFHLYGPLYLSLSHVTLPLFQHIRSFTTNRALSPCDGVLLPP